MVQAMITLTSEESKRMIAKAVCALESVQAARKNGYLGLSLCTTCGFIIQEILGKDAVDPAAYCCGFIHAKGSCCVPDKSREKLLLLEKGSPHWLDFPNETFIGYFERMGAGDVIVKSGNVMDPCGNVGVLLASPDGGEAGAYLPHIFARGIQLIVPMTLNKTVPVSLAEILPYMGISRFRRDRVHGMSCGMLPLPGKVITEIEAFRNLFGLKAVPAAMDGVGSGSGTVTFVLAGEEPLIEDAWQAVNAIKGEPKLKNHFSNCKSCSDARTDSKGSQCSTRLHHTAEAI